MHLLPSLGKDPKTSAGVDLLGLARKTQERLERSGYLALREVSCLAAGQELYLHGCLPSHYLKQLAQETALGVEGVRVVINRITVPAPTSRGRSGRKTASNM